MSKRKYSADQLINECHETLAQWDENDLAEIAEKILGHKVVYEQDSMFTVIEE